ncbi:MAG: selenium cofactor biosynthesis protein YqeC [Halarsenatibacteraceae bacterium]
MKTQRGLLDIWEVSPGELNWFIGAGGKTTTINKLAAELNYHKTIISTTTAILKPEGIPHRVAFINSYQDLSRELANYAQNSTSEALVLASTKKPHPLSSFKGEKLIGLKPAWLSEIAKEFPEFYYLIEADGAANRPIKIPADHEPVLPEAIDNLFLLQGLSSLKRAYNKNLDKRIMHRAELFNCNNKKQDSSKKLSLSTYKMLYSPQNWGKNRFKSTRQIRFILTQINSDILGFSRVLAEYLFAEYIGLDNLKSITAVNYRKQPAAIYHIDREEFISRGYNKIKRY